MKILLNSITMSAFFLITFCTIPKSETVLNPVPVKRLLTKIVTDSLDVPPIPIGGFESIEKAIVYPPMAMAAGIEALVVVQVVVTLLVGFLLKRISPSTLFELRRAREILSH